MSAVILYVNLLKVCKLIRNNLYEMVTQFISYNVLNRMAYSNYVYQFFFSLLILHEETFTYLVFLIFDINS